MKEIYKFIIGTVVILCLLVSADWIVGTWSENMYYKSKYGIYHRQIYCLKESSEDILILGSSRAAHHYVPQIFEDSLGMSCYNAGSDGMCVYYHHAILAARIQRHSIPKIVILEVLPSDVEVSQKATFSLDAALERFAPHYGDLPEIDSLFSLKGWKEKMKLLSKTYRYNSKLVQTIKCNYLPWSEDRGYEALKGIMKKADVSELMMKGNDVKYELEPMKLTYVKKIIDICKDNKIKLFICHSPQYVGDHENRLNLIKDLTIQNDVPFYEYCNEKKFKLISLYKDSNHLNDDGAHEFTYDIVAKIKQSIRY